MPIRVQWLFPGEQMVQLNYEMYRKVWCDGRAKAGYRVSEAVHLKGNEILLSGFKYQQIIPKSDVQMEV